MSQPYKRKASATQIILRKNCALRWFLKYKMKFKEPTTMAMLKGTLVHAVIERMSKEFNPRKTHINARNYKEEFPKYMLELFEDELKKPQEYFGRPQPSLYHQMEEIADDEMDMVREITDAQQIIENYLVLYLMRFEQQLKKAKGFAQAYYMSRPKFSEYKLEDDRFVGYIDQVFEKDGKVIISDIKTGGSYFRSGYSDEYRIQLSLYCLYYYKMTGVLADYGRIDFVKLGRECLYEFNKDTIIDEMEALIDWFEENTASDDIADYPPGLKHKFCCSKYAYSKNSRGKPWCPHASWCDKHIETNGLIPEDYEEE